MLICCCRNNKLWGKLAPSRPLAIHKTRSESNLQDLLNLSNNGEDEPRLSFLEVGNNRTVRQNDAIIIHGSYMHLNHGDRPSHSTPPFSLPHGKVIDKTEDIRNYIASLPSDDDQGFDGENVLCTPESGSGYSSPMSPPTDDEHTPSCYSKLAREIRREAKMNSEGQFLAGSMTETVDREGVACGASVVLAGEEGEDENEGGFVLSLTDTETQQIVSQIPVRKSLKPTNLPHSLLLQCQVADRKLAGTKSYSEHEPLTEVAAKSVSESAEDADITPHSGHLDAQLEGIEGEEADRMDSTHSGVGSGPINGPQILSVPKRVKEIEQMNLQRSAHTTPTPKSSPVPLEASPVLSNKDNFNAVDNGMLEDQEHASGDVDHASPASVTRTSSGHSMTSLASGDVGDDELECLETHDKSSNPFIITRHASISPSPIVQNRSNFECHTRTFSYSSVPSVSQLSEQSGEEKVSTLGAGAVRARVLDIEKSRDCITSTEEIPSRWQSSQVLSVSSDDSELMRRHSFAHRRPASMVVLERSPSSGSSGRPRSLLWQRREATPTVPLSKFVDNLPILPVQDLKKKFEDSKISSIASSIGGTSYFRKERKRQRLSNLRRSQSLRDMESQEKTSHLFWRKNKRKPPTSYGRSLTRTECASSQD